MFDLKNKNRGKIFFITILLFMNLAVFNVHAQSDSPLQLASSTIQNKDAKFLLFPTQNIHIFLKLNTRTGEVYMVQFSTDGKEGEVKIHSYQYPLVKKEEQMNGRFFLYPTRNFYNFLLVDQIDGRVWQVQWNFDNNKRIVTRIFSDTKVWTETDNVLVKNLDYQDLIYYKDGERFDGVAFLDDTFTIGQVFHDGRVSHNG